jgi:DHA1 family bicyclomycin/chloramphenicol resistance-like MFS transporter
MVCAALTNVAFHSFYRAQLPWSVAPLFVYAIGMALAMPNIVLFGLDIFPAQKGMAASCQAFLMAGLNAFTAGVLSPLANVSPLRLAATSALLTGAGLLCMLMFLQRRASAITA